MQVDLFVVPLLCSAVGGVTVFLHHNLLEYFATSFAYMKL